MVTYMETEAPNYNGDYPLAGERMGPAWRELWRMLHKVTWLNAGDAAAIVAPRYEMTLKSVKNLLYYAHKAGLLEQKIEKPAGKKRPAAHYRVVADLDENR